MPEKIILDWIISFSNTGVTVIANLMIHSTLIISLGLCAAFLFRSKSAAVQSLIYRAVLSAVILCVPATLIVEKCGFDSMKLIMPRESIDGHKSTIPDTGHFLAETPPIVKIDNGTQWSSGSRYSPTPEIQSLSLSDFNPFGNSALSHKIRTWLYVVVTVMWLLMTVFLLLRLVRYVFRVQWLRKTSVDADKSIINSVWRISSEFNIEPPDVLLSPFAKSPFLTGLYSPAILLPEGIPITDAILYHEMAHHRRHDCIWNMMSEIACALIPFQPLMTVLSRAIEETSDYVSDNYALAFGDEAHSYARQLASIAAQFQPVRAEAAVGVGFISAKSSLLKRIERILDESGRFFISVKANVVIFTVLSTIGASFLTGFVGFTIEEDKDNSMKIVVVDSHEVALAEEELDKLPVDGLVVPVPDVETHLLLAVDKDTNQIAAELDEAPVRETEPVEETVAAVTQTEHPEDIESEEEETSPVDWIAFSDSDRNENVTSSEDKDPLDLVAVSTDIENSVALISESPEQTYNVPDYDIKIVSSPPEKNERVNRNPEVPRVETSENSSASTRKYEYKKAKSFSWEVMLSYKSRI